jgi:hypothetical protein
VLSSYSVPQLTSGQFYRRVVSNGQCGSDTSNIIHIKVLPSFSAGQIFDNQSICNGAIPAKLEGTVPSGADGSYTYQWQKSSNNTIFVNTDGTQDSYVPEAATANTYYRRIVTSANCSPVYSNSVLISVLPAINAGVINNSQSICYNTAPSQLTGAASSGGMGLYTYQWQSSNDSLWSDIPGEINLSYTPNVLTKTQYLRRITTSGTCGTMPSNIVTIKVYDRLYGGTIKTDQTICYNTTPLNLSDSIDVTGGTGSYSYQWQVSNDRNTWTNIQGALQNEYGPGIMTASSYFRRLVTNACGSSMSNIVTINVLDQIDGGEIESPQSICYNLKPSDFYSSPALGGDGNFTYQWQKSNDSLIWSNILLNGANNDYSPDSLKTTTYFRRLAKSSCGSAFSNLIKIKVMNPVQPGNISLQQTICYNDTPKTIIGSLPMGGSGQYTYAWEYSRDGSNWARIIFSSDSINYSPGALNYTTFFRRKVFTIGCNDTYTNSSLVYVLPVVESPMVTVDSAYCKYSQVTLAVNGTSTNNFVWYDVNNNLVNEGKTFTIGDFLNDQKYTVQATRNDGCKSSPNLLLLKLDNIKADFSPDVTDVWIGNAVRFTNKSSGGKNYIWDFFDGDKSYELNPWHYYNSEGVYNVKLTAVSGNNCQDTIYVKNLITVKSLSTGISNDKKSSLEVFPNPVDNFLYIKGRGFNIQSIRIADMSGKVWITKEISNFDDLTLNVGYLPAGVYMLKIKTREGWQTFKIVKL